MMSAKGLNKTYTLWFLCWEVIERESDLQPFPDLNIEMFFMSLHQRGRSEDGLAETGFHFPGEKRERRSWLCSRDTQKKIKKKYAEAKRVLREKKTQFQTPFPAKLRVFFQEQTRIYCSAEEATKDMATRGLPVKAFKPPETWQRGSSGWPGVHLPRGKRPRYLRIKEAGNS